MRQDFPYHSGTIVRLRVHRRHQNARTCSSADSAMVVAWMAVSCRALCGAIWAILHGVMVLTDTSPRCCGPRASRRCRRAGELSQTAIGHFDEWTTSVLGVLRLDRGRHVAPSSHACASTRPEQMPSPSSQDASTAALSCYCSPAPRTRRLMWPGDHCRRRTLSSLRRVRVEHGCGPWDSHGPSRRHAAHRNRWCAGDGAAI